MEDAKKLSHVEVEMLFAAQGEEMEALVGFARLELMFQRQRAELAACAEKAAGKREELVLQILKLHGFDPSVFEPDIETASIVPKGTISAVYKPASEDKEAERERQRSAAVTLRPVATSQESEVE